MSINAMAWAKRQTCGSPTLKAILLAFADYADETGKAWPSQSRIAQDTELCKRTVREALQTLEAKGFLRREQVIREDGSRGADRVFLFVQGGESDAGGGEPRSPGVGNVVPQGGEPRSPLTTFEPPLNHQNEQEAGKPAGEIVQFPARQSRKPKAGNAPRYTGDFELWWAEYPRTRAVSKSDAFHSFDRLTPEDQDAAIEGAIAYASLCRTEGTPERFICHPAVFLNQRRWETLGPSREAAR